MKKAFFLAGAVLLMLMVPGSFLQVLNAEMPSRTIVPSGRRISDHEARLALARILSYTDAGLEGSLAQYRILLAQAPGDADIQLETAQVLIRMKKFEQARGLLIKAMHREPDNAAILVSLGDVERYTGNTGQAIALYKKVLERNPRSKEALQGLAYALDHTGDHSGSLKVLTGLHREYPDDTSISLQLARAYISNKMPDRARSVLQDVSAKTGDDPRIIVLMADMECQAGHASACRDLYLKALKLSGEKPSLEIQYADRMNTWGDFYRAESIYRKYIGLHPGNLEVSLKLAGVLASMQRYEEAENVYGKLLSSGKKEAAVMTGLAGTKLLEKDPAASGRYAKEALSADPENTDAMQIMAQSLMLMGDYRGARALYERIAAKTPEKPDALIDIGKSYLKEKNTTAAREYFEKARKIGPEYIPARFYEKWPLEVRSKTFLSSVINDKDLTADDLVSWAGLYLDHGLFGEAITCYEEALKKDPEHFPASIGLAEALALDKRYEGSISLYRKLLSEFPDDVKVLMGLARVLGWSKRYGESIALYRRIIALNPADPVPRREMARAAMWGKIPQLAFSTYDKAISEPGFDQRVKRSFYLEKEAKQLAYNKEYARSLPVYESLLGEYPGNEEALFDKAQVQCALGLCAQERKTYERLLDIDPLHGIANEALERLNVRSNPSVFFDYSYWDEQGRGDLARITRNRFDLAFDIPVACQYHISLKGHRWLEHPDYTNRTYGANGFSLGFSGVFNPFIKGEASWTRKVYDSSDFATKDTGYVSLWFNIFDRFRLGTGYARTDELYNFFGIDHGVQADRLRALFHGDITRKFEIDAKAEYINYTDSNSGSFFGLSAGYAFTDHPKIFKITLSGDARNTRNDNEYIYLNGFLADIIHPYWAPKDYLAGSVIFEWHHDLSKLFMCGAEQHYYDLKASFGTDTEDNPYAKLEGEWNYEFQKHWAVGIKGMVHTSPEWNATGAWGHLRYRF